jgi:hypothetical protein
MYVKRAYITFQDIFNVNPDTLRVARKSFQIKKIQNLISV